MLLLFLLAGSFPKFIVIFAESLLRLTSVEDIGANFLTIVIDCFLVICCFRWLERSKEGKFSFNLKIPTQANQLTPFIMGLVLGINNVARYFK